jgi:hypothetical protein
MQFSQTPLAGHDGPSYMMYIVVICDLHFAKISKFSRRYLMPISSNMTAPFTNSRVMAWALPSGTSVASAQKQLVAASQPLT